MKLLLIKHISPEYKTTWDITHLPLHQWYEIESKSNSLNPTQEIFYRIKTPYGSIGWIPQSFFLTKEECREKRLDLLLE